MRTAPLLYISSCPSCTALHRLLKLLHHFQVPLLHNPPLLLAKRQFTRHGPGGACRQGSRQLTGSFQGSANAQPHHTCLQDSPPLIAFCGEPIFASFCRELIFAPFYRGTALDIILSVAAFEPFYRWSALCIKLSGSRFSHQFISGYFSCRGGFPNVNGPSRH